MSSQRLITVEAELGAVFGAAGMSGAVHGIDLSTGTQVCYRSDRLVQPASVAKVFLLVAVMDAIGRGITSLDEVVTIPAGNRTPGDTGLSVMTGPAQLTVRDLAVLMISVSDNDATDRLFAFVSPAETTSVMRALGLDRTAVECTIAEAVERQVSFEPERSPWRTTPEDTTRLLRLIWTDQVASAQLCAEMRTILCTQAFGRLSGVFADDVVIGSKTGTLPGIRNVAGVVEHRDGASVAVAVFTRSADLGARNMTAELAVGAAAQVAVNAVRQSSGW